MLVVKERIEELEKEIQAVSIELKGFRIDTYADLDKYSKLSNYYVSLCDRLAYSK